MRLITLLIFVNLLHISANVYSQNERFTFRTGRIPVRELLDKIESGSNYKFLYRSDYLTSSFIELDAINLSLEELLSQMIEQTDITYRILDDRLIVIAPKTLINTKQKQKVTGLVTDATNGDALPGVNILVEGTTIGVVTNSEGKYSIDVPASTSVLVFSYVGYNSERVDVNGRAVVDLAMIPDIKKLEEVVVIGYGTVKKRDLTGSVGTVSSEELLKGNPASINQGLQGRMAGVDVKQNDGAPGGGVSIQIRGANSFTTSTEPLYIVDGIPFSSTSMPRDGTTTTSGMYQTANPLSMINPQDIESIEILKDASATAIYGSRGANGVVLITTKRGEKGTEKVEFSANIGLSKTVKKIDMLSAYDYALYMNEQKTNQSTYEGTPLGELPYPAPENYLNGTSPDTDWQDQIFQTAVSKEYNLGVNSGSDKGYYAISGNILDQTGVIVKSGYKRYSFRTNVSRKVHKWIEIGTNISFSHSVNKLAKTNASDNSIIKSALFYPPTRAIIDPNSDSQTNWFASNPYLYVRSAKDELTTNNFFSSSFVELSFLKDFKLRQNIGYSYYGTSRNIYYNRKTVEGKDPVNGFASQTDNASINNTFETILTYNKEINKNHMVNVMGAFTFENSNYGGKSMSGTGFPNDLTEEYSMGSAVNPGQLVSSRGETALLSYLGRVNYSLFNRYLFTASYRRDGSSKFATGNKWSGFLSYAFAWRASEENFVKNLNIFDNLKFRVSYGETGNQGIGPYATRDYLANANYPINGTMNSGAANIVWRGPANPNLKWETTRQFDVGADMDFWNNRLNFTIDYYHKVTDDLLQSVQIPMSTGFSSMLTNFGTVTNKGLEFSAKCKLISYDDFSWNLGGNISFNKNEISGLEGDQFAQKLWTNADQVFLQRNGEPIGVIYGYVEDGIYDNAAEVRADPYYAAESDAIVKAMIGEIKYKNYDDDPAVTTADRKIIGDVNPDFVYGITTSFNYKNLRMEMFFQGTRGNDIFNANLSDVKLMSIGNLPQDVYNSRWTAETRETAKWPKAYGGYNRRILLSDRYVEEGSYFRLKNLTLGYTFKSPVKGIETIQLNATVTNVFTITNYSWYDPDVNAFGGDASRRGVDMYSYPSCRTFSMGLQCTF